MVSFQLVDKNFFQENGYFVLKDALPKDDLFSFQETLKKVININLFNAFENYPNLKIRYDNSNQFDEKVKILRQIDASYISKIQRTVSRTPEFYRLTLSPKISDFLRYVLDLPEYSPIYLTSNGIIFTTPNDSENTKSTNIEIGWHKDTFYTIPRSRFVQVWAPVFHNATDEIGTLRVCPGSHKEGLGKQLYDPSADFNHRYSVDINEVNKYQPISIPVNLGEILIFDGRLIHSSGKNISDKVRCSMLAICHDAAYSHFLPVAPYYKFPIQTPEGYFYELYGDKHAQAAQWEQSELEGEPIGGV